MSSRTFIKHNSALYDICIGLEVHAQILASTKLFSRSQIPSLESSPNINVTFFDAALPGTLPILNRSAIDQAIRAAIALNCNINKLSVFDRKHYFYQDLPLGYQITQQFKPIAENGRLIYKVFSGSRDKSLFSLEKAIISRLQIEQDSGKSIHDGHDIYSLIDLNRAGCGLIEIVFSPSIFCYTSAAGALRSLQQILRHIGVSDCSMETGSMRCDVNISVRKLLAINTDQSREEISHPSLLEIADTPFHNMNSDEMDEILTSTLPGQRVEIKNLSSIQKVINAIKYEAVRQVQLLEAGQPIRFETRGYDEVKDCTYHMRDKDLALDYRFFPDPDLPALLITEEDIQRIKETFPELPDETISRIKSQYGLDDYQVNVLMSQDCYQYFEEILKYDHSLNPITVFHWITSELLGLLNPLNMTCRNSPVTSTQLGKIIQLVMNNHISNLQGKELLKIIYNESNPNTNPEDIMKKLGMILISDIDMIISSCKEIIHDPKYASQLQKYLNGKTNLEKFFFGEIMRHNKNKTNPHKVGEVLSTLLQNLLKERGTKS